MGYNTESSDFSQIGNPEADDILEDIVEYLKDRIFIAAEAAYDRNQEMESEEEFEDDDTEEEDEYGDDEEE